MISSVGHGPQCARSNLAQDYDKAAADPNFQFLAKQAITLTNYNAVTHPSQPNYAAVVAGDIFGMDNDDFIAVGNNISTVVDLLDTKGISWAEYQEDQPYAGFQGFNYSNQVTFANDYVRKHNPLIRFGSVNTNATRLSLLKNFTSFESDLAAQTLPQWMFVTPNMTNDGHDTSVTVAANWARNWLTPLLNNSYFMNNTLVLLTFDENETATIHNTVYTLLLGGAVPESLHGTTDDTFYNHYSAISSVSVNWGLPSLGRWDCDANVFETVANVTNYENFVVNATNLFFNSSYPGPLSDALYIPDWPTPDTDAKCASGKGVLPSIVTTWGQSNGTYNYTNVYPYDALVNNNVGGTATLPSSTSSGSASSSASAPAKTSSSAASAVKVGSSGAMALIGALIAFL
jgi:acid phosphatase